MSRVLDVEQVFYELRPVARMAIAPQPVAAQRRGAAWLGVLAVSLLLYALLGKGWAYFGVPPLYIGEILLFSGLLVLLTTRYWHRVLSVPPMWCVLALAYWGGMCMVPYLDRYGIDALRDAVIWAYAAFAIIVAGLLISQPSRLAHLVLGYRKFTCWFLLALPPLWLFTRLMRESLPRWPWADAPMIQIKAGDASVHLAGVLAFFVAGFAGRVRWPWMVLLGISVALAGSTSRGGLVSFLCVFGLCLALKPFNPWSWRLIATMVLAMILAAVTNFQLRLESSNRIVSVDTIITNIRSIATDSGQTYLENTEEWRMDWWRDILDYTVGGPYFWEGKGFGINLADDDGYQVDEEDQSLRSPHNGHLTMLARAGVPGFLIWIMTQAVWAGMVLRRYLQARRARRRRWVALFLFLFCYWLAFMSNATFDVFIEGPMGGIWFWSIYGVGVASMWLYRRCPEVLEHYENPVSAQLLQTARW